MNHLDWDAFRVVLAIVEHGSFSAGARALRISQPTAGRKVATLEKQLGARLFVRGARGVRLTPAGEDVVAEARRMAEGAEAAARRAAGIAPRTLVRISASEGLGAAWLPRRLLAFARENPELRLELLVDNAPVDLSRQKADVSVSVFRPREPDVITRKIATLAFGLFASPAYLEAHGRPRKLVELASHNLIGMPEEQAAPRYEHWLRSFVPRERFVVRSASLLAQHEAARAGFGIVLGTAAVLQEDPALARVLPRAQPPSLDVWLSAHADVRRDAAVAKVFDSLVELFTREAPALRGERRSR